MNTESYKQQLLELEKSLSARAQRAVGAAQGEFLESAHDMGDASVADEVASEKLTEAELDSTVLKQIREALARLEDGTFGKCVVDGAPIEEKRLAAVPWTPYCLKHGASREASAPRRSTL